MTQAEDRAGTAERVATASPSRLVDLTHPIHDGMPTYPLPWHPRTEITQLGRFGVEGRESRRITFGTHTGTHCDAPRHFVPGGRTVESIELEVLVGPAVVLDLRSLDPGVEIDAELLERLLGGRRPRRLLLCFGWSRRWGTFDFFEGHPFLSEAAARFLVDSGVRLLGIDTPTPDDPLTGRDGRPDSPVHKILLEAEVVIVEYMNALDELESDEVELVVAPLKLVGGDGCPVRAFART